MRLRRKSLNDIVVAVGIVFMFTEELILLLILSRVRLVSVLEACGFAGFASPVAPSNLSQEVVGSTVATASDKFLG